MNTFSELCKWVYRLSDPATFKDNIIQFCEAHQPGVYSQKWIDEGIVEVNEVNPESGELEFFTVRFDEYIYNHIRSYLSYPARRIIPDLPQERSKRLEKIQELIEQLETAHLLASNKDYYNRFPLYKKGLQEICDTLERLKNDINKSNKRPPGNPNLKGPSPNERAIVISEAQRLLNSAPDEYKPKQGAHVSEQLKDAVTDNLKANQPDLNISRFQIERVLRKHFAQIKGKNPSK